MGVFGHLCTVTVARDPLFFIHCALPHSAQHTHTHSHTTPIYLHVTHPATCNSSVITATSPEIDNPTTQKSYIEEEEEEEEKKEFQGKGKYKMSSSLGLLLLLLSAAGLLLLQPVESIGINYGQVANNLPSPENVVPLVKSMGATRIKLYDADPKVLKAFANTGVEFIVSIGNEYLGKICRDPKQAQAWIKTNVQPYLPATKITAIAVGNEVLTYNDTALSGSLFPVMQSVYSALVDLNLHNQICVTTAHNLGILQTSYPPSAGKFRPDLVPCLTAIVNFHLKTGSPFLINAYPYFAYKGSPKQVSLDFVLFQPSSGVLDPVSKLHYDNMLFAQVDAVHAALEYLGFKKVCVQISETGWPSKGDSDEPGATPENAKIYNGNLLKLISSRKGTPMRPDTNLNIYFFALFNENMKPGPTSERNYGFFKPDGSPAYALGFNGTSFSSGGSSSSSSNSSGNSQPSLSPPASSSNGYLAITSNAVVRFPTPFSVFFVVVVFWVQLIITVLVN
ncbi:OLC1v1028828C2 [Oldenlandia corymbosa var. corymbosa]|uniref:glucan endo-1,3-beta-D-glucosidase n=1 Tax=Oldenlandia corymbosa var. corymbosa TaxID=529605 RepID=A0AAV1CFS0_OLDCO|nr:OLC1v1028828C2 [Oldenlandia corymbosa var. corymbosa]